MDQILFVVVVVRMEDEQTKMFGKLIVIVNI